MRLSVRRWTSCAKAMAGISLAGILTGCGTSASPWASSGQPMVVLPLAAAGGVDGRVGFAQQFAYELTQVGQAADVTPWLQPLPAASTAARATDQPVTAVPPGVNVLVVPGIFGECVDTQVLPFSDGVTRPRPSNYVEGYRHFWPELGEVRAVQVRGRASSEVNARLVAAAVQEQAKRTGVETIIVVAYSKGLPDTLMAIELMRSRGELPSKLKAVVSVSGVVLGTPAADEFKELYSRLVEPISPLGCPDSLGGEIESLTVKTRATWLAATPVPATIATFSVVAYAQRKDIAPALLPTFDILGRVDLLNDGQVYAAWSVLPRARLLAEVRSDHWNYVLALERNTSPLVRGMASGRSFPREEFFRALVKTVAAQVALH